MSSTDMRERVVEHLAGHVLGPYSGPTEELTELPYRRYLMGTLYPRGADLATEIADELQDEVGGSTQDEQPDDPLVLANEWLPSSIAVSVYVIGQPVIDVTIAGATYREVSKSRWRREELASDPPEVHRVTTDGAGRAQTSMRVLQDRATLRGTWRRFREGWLVTVALVNEAQLPANEERPDPEHCLYQVRITVSASKGTIGEYPSLDLLVSDDEDEELALLHRDAKIFAIGHGCSADWDEVDGRIVRVRTEFLPRHELRGLTFALEGEPDVLGLAFLADESRPVEDLQDRLGEFVDWYDQWIATLPDEHSDVPVRLHAARARLVARLHTASRRMRRGIASLTDADVLTAFRLANRAMLMQMHHSREEDLGRKRKSRRGALDPVVSYDDVPYTWRPFQLAFVLVVLSSVADEGDPDRDTVDLLWFPTGGGKTEAYLAVAAFVLVLRRLRLGRRGQGTGVLTRYTLRLLASQQFQRSATMICALEVLRSNGVCRGRLGEGRFTIGLWLGDEVSPNKWLSARERFEELRDSPDPENPFQLELCPWCGTEIVPRGYSEDDADYGIRSSETTFELFCPNDVCPFNARLPVQVVDQSLYEQPPSFLLGTVDKFARLAWEGDAGSLFGSDGTAPPSLVIQDELHLLSGPLGTMAGLYERAVDSLIRLRGGRPKIVASTATIRRADQQVRGLFGRDVELFPPAGLTAHDSYYSRTDWDSPGRLYVGLMSQSHTATTTLVQASASLLLAPVELGLVDPVRDGYWTLVAYHNTLRELGRSVTQFRDDVPEMIRARAIDEANSRSIGDDAVVELTGNVSGKRLPALLARLFEPGDSRDGVSVLATTSMLSVGVDVDRLGLMLVVGQPKSTSEYIQATSRVGRGDTPGLVVAMLSSTKPRDRSHYEGFRGYHQALYRHVEPTSVTPLALPSRIRALHAALVILVRHGTGLSDNDAAARFNPVDQQVNEAIEILRSTFEAVDPDESAAAQRELERLVGEWSERIKAAQDEGKVLRYFSGTRQLPSLLKNFGASGEGWETPQSMRSVDRQCWLDVLGTGGSANG